MAPMSAPRRKRKASRSAARLKPAPPCACSTTEPRSPRRRRTRNGAWSVTATNLADGAHDFTTTVTDAAGNESAASAARRVAVDTAAPVAAPVAEVKRAADGADVDALTNAKAVTLRGTAEPGAVVKVYDRGAEVASTTADATGAW